MSGPQANPSEDERLAHFKEAPPLEMPGFQARVDIDPDLIQVSEVNTGYDDCVYITLDEARQFRDWLDTVIP